MHKSVSATQAQGLQVRTITSASGGAGDPAQGFIHTLPAAHKEQLGPQIRVTLCAPQSLTSVHLHMHVHSLAAFSTTTVRVWLDLSAVTLCQGPGPGLFLHLLPRATGRPNCGWVL